MKGISAIIICIVLLSTLSVALTTITVQETEYVRIEIELYDPDNDTLSVNFTEPLDEEGVWQTDYGDAGEYFANVIVSDGVDYTEEEILIIVEKKDEKPFIESYSPQEDSIVMNEAEEIEFSITAEDIDKDVLYYRWELDDELVSEEDTFTFSPGYEDSGLYVLNVQINDGRNFLSKGWIIKVNDKDRPPVLKPIKNAIMNEGQKVEIEFEVEDPDGDDVEITGDLPPDSYIEDNKFVWVPSHDTVGKYGFLDRTLGRFHLLRRNVDITFNAKSKNLTVTKGVTITVRDLNQWPTIDDDGKREYLEGDYIEIDPIVNDADGDNVQISFSGWMDGNTKQTDYDDAGLHYVKVKVSDEFSSIEKIFEINVLDNNQEPSIDDIDKKVYYEGELIRIPIEVSDREDSADLQLSSGPEGAIIRNGFLEWTPGHDIAGYQENKEVNFVIIANDGENEVSRDFVLTIKDVNRPPIITSSSPGGMIGAYIDEPVNFSVSAIDGDSNDLMYIWSFGLFEEYVATPVHQRIFTSEGEKKVKVRVSDGEDEVEHEWTVVVAKRIEPVERTPIKYRKWVIDG
ncbi:hypothetical protein ACFLZX_03295 [Nanoarchaeota archaeon]